MIAGKIYHTPPNPARNRPKTRDVLWKMAIRTLPRDPPGEGANLWGVRVVPSVAEVTPQAYLAYAQVRDRPCPPLRAVQLPSSA